MTRTDVPVIVMIILLVAVISLSAICYPRTPSVVMEEPHTIITPPGENDYALMKCKLAGLPVSYSINPENSRGIPENEVVSIIRRAFEEWDDQVPAELFDDNPAVVGGPVTENNRENLVYFTTMSSRFGGLATCPLKYDKTFYIKINQAESSDKKGLLKIALHEVGHVLGLGHPDREGTIMSAGILEWTENLLAPGDILGVKAPYGEKTYVYSDPNDSSVRVSPLFSTPISERESG